MWRGLRGAGERGEWGGRGRPFACPLVGERRLGFLVASELEMGGVGGKARLGGGDGRGGVLSFLARG